MKTGTGEAVSIDTQRIGTQELKNNGERVVLGGIFQHSINNSVDKGPLLGTCLFWARYSDEPMSKWAKVNC